MGKQIFLFVYESISGSVLMAEKENRLFDKLHSDEISIEILKFCKFARPTNEIIDHIYHLGNLASQRTKVMLELSKRLNELEILKAIEYDNNLKSWKTTKIGDRVLNKYFS